MYRRIVMLTNIDFPCIAPILGKVGEMYTLHGGILSTIGAEPSAAVVPVLEKFIETLNTGGDRFQPELLQELKNLYK